jgi:hypothetical protein
MKLFGRKSRELAQGTMVGNPVWLSGQGRVTVVGEKLRSAELGIVLSARELAEGGDWDNAAKEVAALVPNPDIRNDRDTVEVFMPAHGSWLSVGFLGRDDAARYGPTLKSIVDGGGLALARGRLIRGFDGVAVYLHLAGHEHCQMLNAQPTGNILEPGVDVLVGEKGLQDRLKSFGTAGGPYWATLHPGATASDGESGSPTIEARIDGITVGTISAAISTRLLYLLDSPSTPVCEAQIRQGARHADVKLMLPRGQGKSSIHTDPKASAQSAGFTCT